MDNLNLDPNFNGHLMAQEILAKASLGHQVNAFCDSLGTKGLVDRILEKTVPCYSLTKQQEEGLNELSYLIQKVRNEKDFKYLV